MTKLKSMKAWAVITDGSFTFRGTFFQSDIFPIGAKMINKWKEEDLKPGDIIIAQFGSHYDKFKVIQTGEETLIQMVGLSIRETLTGKKWWFIKRPVSFRQWLRSRWVGERE